MLGGQTVSDFEKESSEKERRRFEAAGGFDSRSGDWLCISEEAVLSRQFRGAAPAIP
jgi:hypothetical protein